MASVISSARRSTASAFDLVTHSATTLSQVIQSGSLAADALYVKAQHMHESVRMSILPDMANIRDREVHQAALAHVEFMEDIFKRSHPNKVYDREAAFADALDRMNKYIDDRIK
jgi:hypothetical protein